MTSPWIHTVTLHSPSLQDNTADADRLRGRLQGLAGGQKVDTDLELLQRLPRLLRQQDYRLRVILFQDRGRWQLVDIQAADDPRRAGGLAIDLGTSRVVLRLLDLATGERLAETTFPNPQIGVGPDILTRLHYAETPEGLSELNRKLIVELNRRIAALCRSVHGTPQDVILLSAAGNTAMTHLFMGLDPRGIIREPYIPVVNRPGVVKAAELGLQVHPSGRIFIFPNVGSYFGGDLIAGILFSNLHRLPQTGMLVDVGTNAEVVLGNQQWLMACAGAAGPALEGGVTQMGVMAGPGVIDRIRIDPDDLQFDFRTIGNRAPIGICGSGLIDLAAQLFLAGMLDIRGKLVPEACGRRFREVDGMGCLVVVPALESAAGDDLSISQAEIDSLIRSKAAMYTILETLTQTVGIGFEELGRFFVSGTFGSFIDPAAAITLGMLPDLPSDRYQVLGNSSLEGAARVLLSDRELSEVDAIRDRITYLELNVNQDFMNRFSAAKFLPHTDSRRFPSARRRTSKGN
jgi:uncharacterized 2Fe-2S/4Fe-4S cluster protein (DUF4445 family)